MVCTDIDILIKISHWFTTDLIFTDYLITKCKLLCHLSSNVIKTLCVQTAPKLSSCYQFFPLLSFSLLWNCFIFVNLFLHNELKCTRIRQYFIVCWVITYTCLALCLSFSLCWHNCAISVYLCNYAGFIMVSYMVLCY